MQPTRSLPSSLRLQPGRRAPGQLWLWASLEGLLEALAGPNYKTDHSDLAKRLDDLRANKAIRTHANKYIAHLDFDLLAGIAAPPESIGILDMEDALRIIREFITETGKRFLDESPLEFEEGAQLMAVQAEDLVETLRKGLKQ